MSLIPLRDDLFFPLEQVFDKFYQDFFHNKAAINTVKSNQTYPKMNVYLEDDSFIMKLAVPGLNEDNGRRTLCLKPSFVLHQRTSTIYIRKISDSTRIRHRRTRIRHSLRWTPHSHLET